MPQAVPFIAAAATVIGTVSGISSAREAQKAQAATEEVTLEQAKIAEDLHNFWKTNYRRVEVSVLTEALNDDQEYVAEYEQRTNQIKQALRTQFTLAYQKLDQVFAPYCFGQVDKFIAREIALANNQTLIDLINFSYRYAEVRAQALNDRSWNRLTQVSSLGRGMMNEALSYSQAAADTYSSIGANAANNARDSIYGVGYLLTRNKANGNIPQYTYQTPGINPNG